MKFTDAVKKLPKWAKGLADNEFVDRKNKDLQDHQKLVRLRQIVRDELHMALYGEHSLDLKQVKQLNVWLNTTAK